MANPARAVANQHARMAPLATVLFGLRAGDLHSVHQFTPPDQTPYRMEEVVVSLIYHYGRFASGR
jgi:hypothetical protein